MFVDRAAQTLQFWVGDAQAVNLTSNAPGHSNGNWPTTLAPLRIGSLGLNDGGATVYVEDLALGSSRIGCE